jgi:GNAT superfamily N-acetyltransferase
MGVRGLKVREGTPKDVDELVRQRHRMFEDMGHATRRAIGVHDRAFPGWVRREMRAGRFVAFLVETDKGEVVAGGSLWLREVQPYPGFPGGRAPYLMSMYTEPSFRGKGVGTMVVKRAVEWSKKHGYSSMTLHSSGKGRPLYEKLGWEASSEMELEF